MTDPLKVKIIGVGGVGGWLAGPLHQFLNFRDPGAEITLIDGDVFEDRNRERQVVEQLGNKAEVTAERLARSQFRVYIRAQPMYIDDRNVVRLIREGDIVLLCVDNDATRKIVSDRCEELENVVCISGGNEYTDGTVQVYVRRGGRDLSLPLANRWHPELVTPQDRGPADIGCGEQAAAEPQLLITNFSVASRMLEALYLVLERGPRYDEQYFDILSGHTRPVRRMED